MCSSNRKVGERKVRYGPISLEFIDLVFLHTPILYQDDTDVRRPAHTVSRTILQKRRKIIRMLIRDRFQCLMCGARHRLNVDHIKPKAVGGGDKPFNWQTLCWNCNQTKADKYMWYVKETEPGLYTVGYDDPRYPGNWRTDSDHDNEQAAVHTASQLNGSLHEYAYLLSENIQGNRTWTVGYFVGEWWIPVSDHSDRDEARKQTIIMNNGGL